ncbi:MAG: DUF3987 domain-containing protein [Colwellia sp.]|nr:DUF3987 domain-containing protein [Colwellia sp.]MCW8864063.1 DUF3987 domain-containing protein [Colwellia sp.]MCW9081404.1 DUF3987 domain-containing protein [Colwellia sp.]
MNLTDPTLIPNNSSDLSKQRVTLDKNRILHLANLHMHTIDDSENALFCFKAFKDKCVNQFNTNDAGWPKKLLANIEQGFEVFITVNKTDGLGTKTENIKAVRALFLDFDSTDIDNLAVIESMPLQPNMVLNTSPGRLHCYWQLIDCPLDKFTSMQKALAKKYNGDLSVSDLPRIMRLAGSFNLKNKPHQVDIIWHHDEAYTLDEFTKAFNIGSFGSDDIGGFQKNNTEIPISRADGIEQKISNISLGNNLHESLVSLAGYFAQDGMSAQSIITYLQSQMKISSVEKDDRYYERFNEIPRITDYVTVNQKSTAANSYWPTPKPLESELRPVMPLNVGQLPKVMRDLISDSAERMQCPPDFLAAGLVVVSSSIVARNIVVQPKKNDTAWLEVPNTWGIIIGKPSLLKSPTLSIAMAALEKLERLSREQHADKVKEFKVDCELAEMNGDINKREVKKLLKEKNHSKAKAILMADQADNEEAPTQVRYVINDGTIEKIADLLCTNTQGFMEFRDEIIGWFNNLNKPDKSQYRSFYLESWNGNKPFSIERIGRGSTFIPNNRLTILGGIQPDVFSKLVSDTVSGSHGGDGLLQRFQIAVYPDVKGDLSFTDKAPNKQALQQFENKILSLTQWSNNATEPFVLKFNDAAYEHYKKWFNYNESLFRGDALSASLESHYAKYRGFVPSIAAIFHALEHDHLASVPYINEGTIKSAIEYVEYLRTHAERIYSLPEQYSLMGARTILKNFDKLKDTFLVRDIYRKKWKGLTSKELVEPALAVLEEAGYCMPLENNSNGIGRPTSYFVKHPDYQLPKLTKSTTDKNNKEVHHARPNY